MGPAVNADRAALPPVVASPLADEPLPHRPVLRDERGRRLGGGLAAPLVAQLLTQQAGQPGMPAGAAPIAHGESKRPALPDEHDQLPSARHGRVEQRAAE